jgi:competence protein ComEC
MNLLPRLKASNWLALIAINIGFSLVLLWQLSLIGSKFSLEVFAVPLGDAFLIKTPEGHQITIDGGIDTSFAQKLESRLSYFHRQIDLMIITHNDSDHLNGALETLLQFPVANILIPGSECSSNNCRQLYHTARKQGVNIIYGNQRTDFKSPSVDFDLLYPFTSLQGNKLKKENNASLVFKASFKEHSLLFTGDIEADVEQKLLKQPLSFQANILKVAHHGSKSSSTANFLGAVNPTTALISADKNNRFNHPHQEVIERLEQAKTKTLITANEGDFELVFD